MLNAREARRRMCCPGILSRYAHLICYSIVKVYGKRRACTLCRMVCGPVIAGPVLSRFFKVVNCLTEYSISQLCNLCQCIQPEIMGPKPYFIMSTGMPNHKTMICKQQKNPAKEKQTPGQVRIRLTKLYTYLQNVIR